MLAEKRGAKSGLATMCAENLETNSVEIGAEEGARFVASGGAQQSDESLLGQFLCLGGFGDTTPKETIDRLLVAREELRESVR